MEYEVKRLVLWIDNNEPLQRQLGACYKNLTIKKAQGKYDAAKAPKLFMYLVDRAAQHYCKELEGEGSWNRVFPKSVREEAAKELTDRFEKLYNNGEFTMYVPKKYQSKRSVSATEMIDRVLMGENVADVLGCLDEEVEISTKDVKPRGKYKTKDDAVQAVAAWLGWKKYGKEGMIAKQKAGRKAAKQSKAAGNK